ncbi:MAG: thiamine phosphate synthase [Lentisphaeria bacterium]
MKFDKKHLTLYAITDSQWLNGRSLEHDVELAIKNGATMIQVREKKLNPQDFMKLAANIKKITARYHIPMLINDDVDVAIACDADGVHVGQHDMEAGLTRKKLGPNKIIGVSADTVERALNAEKMGADYIGVGAVFSTSTKLDASAVTRKELKAICKAVSIPVVAIGGITAENIIELSGTGIAGISVISAIFAQPDIAQATRQLAANTKRMLANDA